MRDEYTSFFLKDLLQIIDKIALDNQREPNMMLIGKDDPQLYLLRNASIAAYNRGILKMREALIEKLASEEDDSNG